MADHENTIQELKDTLAVVAAIQERQAALLKDHTEWLADHDKAMLELRQRDQIIDARIEKLREAGHETDGRIEKLVLAIGELIKAKN